MPERWERELRKIRQMEMREPAIRDRIQRGPSGDRPPPRKHALLAGIVAGAVAVAGIAALWQLDRNPDGVGDPTVQLPTLVVTFQSGRMIVDQPDAQIQRVDTTIVYGDAREESFTSTISEGAHIDWAGVEDLTRFVPGPTAGSQVRFEADGEDARVLIGRPADWPEFDQFSEIDRLPEEPGDYVLVFEATYADGIARTARFTQIVSRGELQLDVAEGKSLYAATALGYLDGQRVDGFLSKSWFTLGDVDAQSDPASPEFAADAWLSLPSGTPMTLVTSPSEAQAGLVPSYGEFDLGDPLPLDLLESAVIEGPAGRQLLAVDVTWRHGSNPVREEPTEERAVFFFPVEIVTELEPSPPPAETPTPEPGAPGVVTVDIRRSSEATGDPEAIARFGTREQWMCPDGWSVVNPDGSTDDVLFDCGQDEVFEAPPDTPIVVSGDFATVNVSTRLSGNGSVGAPTDRVAAVEPGTVVTHAYEVTWDDGSEASFWILITVGAEVAQQRAEEGIVVRVYGLGERSFAGPTATFSFGGETRTACTQDFEWAKADGTTIGEVMPDTSSCSGRAIAVPPGTSIAIQAATTSRVITTRTTTQFFQGDVGLVVSAEWSKGNATFIVPLTVVEAAPGLQLVVLDCPPGDRTGFAPPEGARILPGGSAYITGNLGGFLQGDVVEQMTTHEGGGAGGWDGTWQVVRDGSIVATVEFPMLSGIACAGTGIGGA
jgi:hypothetical protein